MRWYFQRFIGWLLEIYRARLGKHSALHCRTKCREAGRIDELAATGLECAENSNSELSAVRARDVSCDDKNSGIFSDIQD